MTILRVPTSSASLHCDNTVDTPVPQSIVKQENMGDENYDACLNPPAKKRRLAATQVEFLERNFEVENKIEPERKIQLAKELGLQPRQVAIWFQNRRARFKNKQLEKDYDTLKASYDNLKVDYDNLLKEKQDLRAEFICLKEKLDAREEGIQNVEPFKTPITPMVTPKREDGSSAKSDVFDSDSPHSFMEPADSCNVFEADQSDFSQDEEDDLSQSFLPAPCFTKLYYEPPANSCTFEFPMEDQPFWSWSY
ncbi:homeobox-leucine zipper protein HAT5-like [Mercurialis annua]|uniref:homeobox-leucine zipper protein HAT5-like n=1 Tax=Mercurialis annua TaxID=3986 RepID=UPI0021602769|nr:homeobox-leucine zipper protein HAT5-like [Mercurialis annua]